MGFIWRSQAQHDGVGLITEDRSAKAFSPESTVRSHTASLAPPPLDVAGLLFDTGDVLYDATGFWRWVVRLLSHMGYQTQFPSLYSLWKRDYLSEVNCGKTDYWDTFRQFLRFVGLTAGQIDEIVIASQPKCHEFDEDARPFPGVKSTLACLSAFGFSLGALSNSPCSISRVSQRLERLGISGYFTTVLSSSELGFRPTDGRGFRVAANAMGMRTEEIAFVGHDAHELRGASAAGMSTIAFNHDPDASASVFVDRLEELTQVARLSVARRRAG